MKPKPRQRPRWTLITGLSGAGKTTAMKILEDEGFFSIDNLPLALLPSFIALLQESGRRLPRVALGLDAREKNFIDSYPELLSAFRDAGVKPEIWFFESRPEILIRRYSESRRPHPLGKRGSLAQAIAAERRLLAPLREISTKTFDTSELNIHELKQTLRRTLHHSGRPPKFLVQLLSFGFKHGLPAEADLVFDVRFLKNPYFVASLKRLDGRSRAVQKFVLGQKGVQMFLRRLVSMLLFLLPLYKNEGKSQLTIAVGCTGGRHRSVVLVEALAKQLKNSAWALLTAHRDAGKE
ncbi:MAG TPA: RNase adapter RapZ [Deltaproteobacteria bacterium]|nr:RNase adapter RapZ [Deltaproteobacteria bacterium]